MFCSKCGKTMRAEDRICRFCNQEIGDVVFGSAPYTSAQSVIKPGESPYDGPVNDYTRTTYTSKGEDMPESGDIDSRTTYRPVYRDIPEDVARSMHADVTAARAARSQEAAEQPESAQDEAEYPEEESAGGYEDARPREARREYEDDSYQPREYDEEDYESSRYARSSEPLSQASLDMLDAVNEDLRLDDEIDLEQFRPRPIESRGRTGISRSVSEYMARLEEESAGKKQTRRGRHRSAAEAPVDYEESYAQDVPEYAQSDAYADADGEYENDYPEYATYEGDDYIEDDGYIPDEYLETDDRDFEPMDRARGFGLKQILKVLIALVVVAAIAVGAVFWVQYIRDSQSAAPIEGVSETFYEQGIALLKTHVSSNHVNQRIALHTSDGVLRMSAQLEEDSAALSALMPAEPAFNDATFLSALLKIQNNINNAITMDAFAVNSTNPSALSDSEARWTIVNNAILQLESVTEAAQLTGIINGQAITVQTETPAPTSTPEPIYPSLTKGDKSNLVMTLQNRLYALGYLNDDRDGNFGGKTQTAVKLFQETAGLTATGIADHDTQKLLYSDSAPRAPGSAS